MPKYAYLISGVSEALWVKNGHFQCFDLNDCPQDYEAQAHISKTVIGCIIGAIWTIVGIVSMCNIWGHIMTVAQIYLAPKVWLIEYAASLVK